MPPRTSGVFHIKEDRRHMATTFSLVISCEEARVSAAGRLLTRIHAEFSRLEGELSEFRLTSPIYRFNEAEPDEKVVLTAAGAELLDLSEKLRAATYGAFDCTAKSGPGAAGHPRIVRDETGFRIRRPCTRTHLGFGAIGKGYALDRARAMLADEGFGDYLLSAGGSSIAVSGFAAPHEPWKLGWTWKKEAAGRAEGRVLEHTTGKSIALGISGNQEQGNHLIDPATGDREAGPVSSALVLHASAAVADALSTAAFVRGLAEACLWEVDSGERPVVAVIGQDGRVAWNTRFEAVFGRPVDRESPPRRALQAVPFLGLLIGLALGALTSIVPTPVIADAAVTVIAGEEEIVDLGGSPTSIEPPPFRPYVFERHTAWLAPALIMIALCLAHLKKSRNSSRRKT